MLKVECEGCRSLYRVDERRIPPGGLKMRCPKCGRTFVVHAAEKKDAPPPAPPPAVPPPPALRTAASKRTVMGIGDPNAALGVRPATPDDDHNAGLPVVSTSPAAPARPAPPSFADLPSPAPGARPAPPRPAAPKPPPPMDDDLPVVGRPGATTPAQHPPIAADFPPLDLPVVATPRAPAPKAPPPPARPAPPRAPSPSAPTADLPAVAPARGAKPGRASDLADFGDLPLPVVSPGVADLPAVGGGADLPAPVGSLDLPSPQSPSASRPARQITGAALFSSPDLPAVAPPPPAPVPADFGDNFGELDLPSVGAPAADLPVPAPVGLPAPANVGLPAPAGVGLPAPSRGDGLLPSPVDPLANLPKVADPAANLPSVPAPGSHLPSVPTPGSHLPSPQPVSQPFPAPSGEFAFDTRGASAPPPGAGVWPEPPLASADTGDDLFGALPPPRTSARPTASPAPADGVPPAVTRQAGGGTAFGEVNLAGDGAAAEAVGVGEGAQQAGMPSFGERDLKPGDEDMEFGEIPQEAESGGGAEGGAGTPVMAQGAPQAPRRAAPPVDLPPKKSKALRYVAAGLAVFAVGGIAMAASPTLGAFGVHIISDTLNANKHQRALQDLVASSRKKLGADTADQSQQAVDAADAAVNAAPRFAPAAAYAAYLGFHREIRFGAEPAVHAHATALLARATEAKEARYSPLARAAEAAANGEVAKARQAIQALARQSPEDIDVAIVEGEVELMAGEYKNALAVWERATKLEDSARTSFGKARALFGMGELDKAREAADLTIKRSKDHVGARILLARIILKQKGGDEAAALLDEIVGPAPGARLRVAASKAEQVTAYTQLGQINLERSKMSASEAAFAEALKLNAKDADALCGFGEVLYREGRYAEALARFEAGIQANPESLAAKIGAAKTKIALERLQEAKELLRKLRESRPADPVVAFWLARVEEALGNKPEVEKILVEAIARTPTGPDAINLYVALSQFLAAQGRMQEADAKLAEARQKLPESPAIHKALGNVALASGRLADAKAEFEVALHADPRDLSSLFNLGVTLRRMGRFDEASEMFDKVSNVDKNYPGLALERGVLFEASGQVQRALEMYQEALSKAPNDPDLMLRVGSAEVGAGHAAQAEEILRKVLQERPNSAEANHYLGRAQLLKGTNLAEAIRFLKRATEIDPNRAEYWLYVGWAANEAGQPGTADAALKKALELDQSLADAYWQRGVLERRQGAVRDAERDLNKALELKPSRFEAHATLAECYEDMSRWDAAITAWRKAIAADGNRSFWRYKLGRLYYNNNNRAAAAEELSKAIQLAEKEARPPWLWEAYLMLADMDYAANRRQEAIDHYREFLKLAAPDSPFRVEAIKKLQALGAQYDGR